MLRPRKLAVFAILVAILVAGCRPAPVPTPTAVPPTPVPKPVKLTYWHIGGLFKEIEICKRMTEEFNKTHPDIQVEFVEVPWEGAAEKVISSFEAKTLPDIIAYPSVGIGEFSGMGIYVPLSDEFPELVEDFAKRVADPIIIDAMRAEKGTMAGKGPVWGIPYGMDMPLLAYNTKMFEEAGLTEPPKTYSELLEYAKKLTTDDVKGFTFAGKATTGAVGEFMRFWLPANGGRPISEDGTKVIGYLNSDAGVKALEFLCKLVEERVVPDNLLDLIYMDNARLFFGGKVAMFRGATWMPGVAEDLGAPPEFPYALTAFPKPDPEMQVGKFPPMYAEFASFAALSITTQCEHKEEAAKFIKWMTRDEILNLWITEVRARLPIAISGLTSDECKRYMPGIYESYKAGTLFEGAGIPISFTGMTEMDNTAVMPEIQKALVGEKSPKEALDDAAAKCQKILDEILAEEEKGS